MLTKKILLIDDESIARAEFTSIFRDSKYSLKLASNSIEGLAKISSETFDLVLLDIRMPDLNNRFSDTAGIELLKKIKKTKPKLPVIMISVLKEIEIGIKAMKLGAKDYIVKDNFTTDELFKKIEKIILKKSSKYASLIKKGESEKVEFKASLRYDLKTGSANKELGKVIAKSVSGFLNSTGGYLFIGIADNGEPIGIENDLKTISKKTEDAFLSTFYQLIVDYLGKEFCQKLHTKFSLIENKKICVIKIESSDKPAWFKDGKSEILYIRTGQSTRPLNSKEAYEYCLNHFDKK